MGTPITLSPPPNLAADDILVRQSTVGSFALCPARVGYELAGETIPPVSDAMVFGTIVHHLCEFHIQNGSAAKLTKPKEFDVLTEQVLNEQYDFSIAEIGAPYKKFRRLVIEAYRLWVFQVFEHVIKDEIKGTRRFYTEQDLYVPLQDGMWARGTPDLATLRGMRDFKTTNAAFKWTQSKVDTDFQATYYLALHNKNFGKDWQLQNFRFIVYDRKNHDWNMLDTSRTPEQMEAALLIAEQYGLQMKAGAFPATPFVEEYKKWKPGWYCSPKWCGAWNACVYKGIAHADASEEAAREWR